MRSAALEESVEPRLEDAVRSIESGEDRGAWVDEELCDLSNVRIPRISIHIFGETEEFEHCWERTINDRRMARTSATYFKGGFVSALRHYVSTATPELLVIETQASIDVLQYEVDSLAEICDPGTRLVIIGHNNDIQLYRKLLQMGVSNYVVAPVTVAKIVQAISEIYSEPGTEKIGQSFAFIGAKGGVGASMLAQNVAFELAQSGDAEVLLADFDMAFGSTTLNLDIEPNHGLSELLDKPDLINAETIDRVLIKRGVHLNILVSPPGVDVDRPVEPDAVDRFLDVVQQHIPFVVLDLPHEWCAWTRQAIIAADKVVIVSTPEVCSLRNAAALHKQLEQMRPNDRKPLLVLTQVGMPRRDEVSEREIENTLKISPALSIPFDAGLYSDATGRGKMLSEVGPKRPASLACRKLAGLLNPRKSLHVARSGGGLFRWFRRSR